MLRDFPSILFISLVLPGAMYTVAFCVDWAFTLWDKKRKATSMMWVIPLINVVLGFIHAFILITALDGTMAQEIGARLSDDAKKNKRFLHRLKWFGFVVTGLDLFFFILLVRFVRRF